MVEKIHEDLYYVGALDPSYVVAYSLFQHLQETTKESTPHMQVLDVLSSTYLFNKEIYEFFTNKHGFSGSDFQLYLSHGGYNFLTDIKEAIIDFLPHDHLDNFYYHTGYLFELSLCDRDRLVDAIKSISGGVLYHLMYCCLDHGMLFKKYEELHSQENRELYKKEYIAYFKNILGELAVITIAKDQKVAISQGTVSGDVQRIVYKGGLAGAENLLLSECAIKDDGVCIHKVEAKDGDVILTIKNGFTAREIVLRDNVSGTKIKIAKDETYSVTGKDLENNLDVLVQEVTEPETQAEPEAET